MSDYEIKLMPLEGLKPHEKIVPGHLVELMVQIKKDGFISEPIIVDRATMVILDGHHRFNILKIMGLKLCPVCMVDYKNDATITVDCWRAGEKITKEEVLAAGLSGKLLDPKTSRHSIPERPKGLSIALSGLR